MPVLRLPQAAAPVRGLVGALLSREHLRSIAAAAQALGAAPGGAGRAALRGDARGAVLLRGPGLVARHRD